MANQNIGTPRLYIDYLSYLNMTGKYNLTPYPSDFTVGLNPSSMAESVVSDNSFGSAVALGTDNESEDGSNVAIPKELPINYWAILGHNYGDASHRYIHPHFHKHKSTSPYWEQCLPNHTEIVNSDSGTDGQFYPSFNGFTITEMVSSTSFNPEGQTSDITRIYIYSGDNQVAGYTYRTGSMAIGKFYDMPHSPELSLTMSHEYDGIKKQETAGGSTLSYSNYYKPPDWGDLQAWQLENWKRKYSGRRIWNLSFNYLSDSDIEPYHYNMDGSSSDAGIINPNYKDNWFTNVIHYTNGGQLPFIFCPDPSVGYASATWTVPEFAICRFDMSTFKREQVANGVYNIKVKIKETW